MLAPLAKSEGPLDLAGNFRSPSLLWRRQFLQPLLFVSVLVATSAVCCEATASPKMRWFVSAQRPMSFDPFVTATGNIAAVLNNPMPLDGTVADVQNVFTEIDALTGETILQKPQPLLTSDISYPAVTITAFSDASCVNLSALWVTGMMTNPLVASLSSRQCLRYLPIVSQPTFAHFIACSPTVVIWKAYSDSSCNNFMSNQNAPVGTCVPITGVVGVSAIKMSCASIPIPSPFPSSIPGADAHFSKAGCFLSPALARFHLQPCPSDSTTNYMRVSFRVSRSCMTLYKCRANWPYAPRRNVLVAVNSDATVAWDYSPSDLGQPFFNDSNANFEYSIDPAGDVVTLQAFSSNNASSATRFTLQILGGYCYINGSAGSTWNVRPNILGGLNVTLLSLSVSHGLPLFSASIRVLPRSDSLALQLFEPCATVCIPSNVDHYSYFVNNLEPSFVCNSPNYDKNTSTVLALDNGGVFGMFFKQSGTMGVRARKVVCPASVPAPCYSFNTAPAAGPYIPALKCNDDSCPSECPNTLVLIGHAQLVNASIDLPPSVSPYSCPQLPIQLVADAPFFVVTAPVNSQQTNLRTSRYSASNGLLDWQFNRGLLPQAGNRPDPAVFGLQVDWFYAGDPNCCDASLPCSQSRVGTQNVPLNVCTPNTYTFKMTEYTDSCDRYSPQYCQNYFYTVLSCSSSHAVVDVSSSQQGFAPSVCPANIEIGKRIPKCSINSQGYLMRITCSKYYNQSASPSKVYPTKTVIDDDGTVFLLSMLPLVTSATRTVGLRVAVAALSARGLRLWSAQYDFPESPIDTPFDLAPPFYEFNGAVQQFFASYTDRVLIVASPTLSPFAVDKGSGRETWRLSDASGVSLLTVCTEFAVRRNSSAPMIVFGDCEGRMWAFDVSDVPPPPASSTFPPLPASTLAPPSPPPPTTQISPTTHFPATTSAPSTPSPLPPPVTSTDPAHSTPQPSSVVTSSAATSATPATTAPATSSPSSTAPSSTPAPTMPQPFSSLPPATIAPIPPPVILILSTSFYDNWQSLADRLTQLLNCPTPLVFLKASQLLDGSWNVSMAVEVLLPLTLQSTILQTLIAALQQPFCSHLIMFLRVVSFDVLPAFLLHPHVRRISFSRRPNRQWHQVLCVVCEVLCLTCATLCAPLDHAISAVSGHKVVDSRTPIAAWAVLAAGCIVVLALSYIGAWVCWQKYVGMRHTRLEDESEMNALGDEEQQGTYVARGQQLQFSRDDSAQ